MKARQLAGLLRVSARRPAGLALRPRTRGMRSPSRVPPRSTRASELFRTTPARSTRLGGVGGRKVACCATEVGRSFARRDSRGTGAETGLGPGRFDWRIAAHPTGLTRAGGRTGAGRAVGAARRRGAHLADRLEAVLRGGAQAVGCQAAALYLLDDGTSQLKLRAAGACPWIDWLLRRGRCKGPWPTWKPCWDTPSCWKTRRCCGTGGCRKIFPPPFACPSPRPPRFWARSGSSARKNAISTSIRPTSSRSRRPAGRRLGTRNPPGRRFRPGPRAKKQLAAAERLQRNQLPTIPPLLDGWDLCGWTAQAGSARRRLPRLVLLARRAGGLCRRSRLAAGVDAALAASGLRAALRAHGQYHRQAGQTVKCAEPHALDRLGRRSASDAGLRPARNRDRPHLLYALAGRTRHRARSRGRLAVAQPQRRPVGRWPRVRLPPSGARGAARRGAGALHRGDSRCARCRRAIPWGKTGLARPWLGDRDLSAAEMVSVFATRLRFARPRHRRDDCALLILKRKKGLISGPVARAAGLTSAACQLN